jgi:DNA-binding transcriptional ArsR family regulator
MPNQEIALDNVFHALADPTRRAVLHRLSQGPASVKELAQPFEMALPSFLQHLKVLESGGLIRSKKVGRVRTCEMEPAQLTSAEAWIAKQRSIWEGRLDRLEAYLSTLQAKDEGDGEKA